MTGVASIVTKNAPLIASAGEVATPAVATQANTANMTASTWLNATNDTATPVFTDGLFKYRFPTTTKKGLQIENRKRPRTTDDTNDIYTDMRTEIAELKSTLNTVLATVVHMEAMNIRQQTGPTVNDRTMPHVTQ